MYVICMYVCMYVKMNVVSHLSRLNAIEQVRLEVHIPSEKVLI